MLPDRVSNPGPLTYESGALPIALRGPAFIEYLSAGIIYSVYNKIIIIIINKINIRQFSEVIPMSDCIRTIGQQQIL